MDKYTYWYGNIKGLEPKTRLKIKEAGLTPEDAYFMKFEEMRRIFGEVTTEKIILSRKLWDVESEWEALQKKGIKYVTMLDPDYPDRMQKLPHMPFGLYYKGHLPEGDKLSAGVVGARMSTPYGKAIAEEIGRILGKNKVNVISGLAKGVDGIAQRGALEGGGESFGVLGCGADICYPASNIDLYMELEKKGGIISEQPPGMQPIASFFPARNRIISALSDIVIVVEAKEKSGSLITADMALEQGRDVIAVPGRITDKTSEGCNQLIAQGAEIYTGPETLERIIKELSGSGRGGFVFDYGKSSSFSPELSEKEAKVYECLDIRPKRLECILEECPLPFSEVMGILMDLEIKGLVAEATRNTYYVTSL